LTTDTQASTTVVQPPAPPPAVQISLALGDPTAGTRTVTGVSASIAVNSLSAQIAGGNSMSYVIHKAIDSASPQFQQAYLTKTPMATLVITIQRSSGKLTLKLTNALVTNDIQSSGGSSGEQVTLSPSALEFGSSQP
jgi:type VI protein secretion system component Hcp